MTARRLRKSDALAQTVEALQDLPDDERILIVSLWRYPTTPKQDTDSWAWSVVVTRTLSNEESRGQEGIWDDVEEQRLKITGLLIKQIQDRPLAVSYQVYGWQVTAD